MHVHFLLNIQTYGIFLDTVKVPVSRGTPSAREAEKVSATGAGRLRERFS